MTSDDEWWDYYDEREAEEREWQERWSDGGEAPGESRSLGPGCALTAALGFLFWLMLATAGADIDTTPGLASLAVATAAAIGIPVALGVAAGRNAGFARMRTLLLWAVVIACVAWVVWMFDSSMRSSQTELPAPCQDNWGNCG